jgi:uncharacterized membrane protein
MADHAEHLSRLGTGPLIAIGAWLGGLAARAAQLHDSPWALLLVAGGGAAAFAFGRAFPLARSTSPLWLFLPLTLLPSIPGWRTLGAALLIFTAGWAVDRRAGLDDPARARLFLGIALAAGGALATTVGLLRLYWLADVEYGQDTAYAANLLWNTLHGDFLRSGLLQDLLNRPPLRNDFGAHNSPLQLLLLPWFCLWPSPALLIVLRNLALWIAPWLLFRHLRTDAGPRAALYVSLALAVQTTVLWQSVNAFYFMQMSLPLLVMLVAAWERVSLRWTLVLLAILLGFREDLAVVAVALGGVALLQRRRWPWAAAPVALGLSWWVVSTRWVMPAGGAGLGGAVNSTLAAVGGTPSGIVMQALHDPGPLLRTIFREENLAMLGNVACALGGIGLLSPLALVALPFAGITALVDFSPAKEVFMHYHLLPVPFVIVGGLRVLQRAGRKPALTGPLVLGMLCAIAAQDARMLPVAQLSRALRPENADLGRAVRAAAGEAESVGAPGAYLPLLANRPSLFLASRLWQYPDAHPEIVIWDPDPFRANPLPADRERYRRWPAEALGRGEYRIRAELPGGVLVLQRSAGG